MFTFIYCLLLTLILTFAHGCENYSSCTVELNNLRTQIKQQQSKKLQTWLNVLHRLAVQELDQIQLPAIPERNQLPTTNYCPTKAAFEFIIAHQTTIKLNTTVQYDAHGFDACYPSMNVQFHDHVFGKSGGKKWGYVHFTVPLPSKLICSDAYVIGTKYATRQLNVGTIDHLTKKMHLNISYLPGEYADVLQNGLQIMVKPCGAGLGTIQSILATVNLFYNQNATQIRQANEKFLLYRGVYDKFVKRSSPNVITAIDKTLLNSGDNLQVVKLDGLDTLIAFGTGGRTGHTALVVWNRNHTELFVCESTDASPFGAYWPPPYGIIKTPFDQWFQQAVAASFVVDILPLSHQAAKEWNNDEYWNWFEQVQGMPYGYHVMLYSFLDTYNPARNLPKPLNDKSINFMLPYLDRLVGNDNKAIGSNMYSLIGEGLNHRLNTTCVGKNMQNCLSDVLVARNLSYSEATSIPEQDEWKYDGNLANNFTGNYSMMCSAFVANSYKVGLGGSSVLAIEFNSHEFTPKDVYQLSIFDTTGERFNKDSCPNANLIVDSDGKGNYCQMIGEFELVLPGFNSITPYSHMNDRCSAQWPDYNVDRPC